MKKIIYVALAMLVLASCEKPNKIGFVDNGKVINDFQEKIDLEARFEKSDEAFRKRTDSIGRAFQVEAQSIQAEAQKLAKRNNMKKAQELMGGLQQKRQELEQQVQYEDQQIKQSFQAELDSIIKKVKIFESNYGKENGFTYILGTSDAASTVLYGTEENDLSKTILDALNAEYKKEE